MAVAALLPSLVWLAWNRRGFAPRIAHAALDLKAEWPGTRWVLFSGLVWNAGMSVYPWVIDVARGKIEVAVWGACYQLAAVANPLLMGLQNFTGPRIAEAHAEKDAASFARFVYRTAAATSLLMIGPAVAVSCFAGHALHWLSRGQFDGQSAAIAFLSAAVVLQAVTFTLSRGLFALRRADLDLYCNFGPLLLLFTGGWALTSRYGTAGAAASMLIAQVLSSGSRVLLFHYAARQATRKAAP
jgi:O-antigen/teichoic acid export membrane protein